MSIVTELHLLLKLRRQIVKNDVIYLTKDKVIRFSLLLGIGLVFFILDYLFFHRIIAYIARIDIDIVYKIEVGTILVARLLNMIFLTFFSMLLFSNVVVSLSTFYLSSDLGFLLSSPIRFSSIFTMKFVETMLNSSGILLIFGLPIFIVCGQEYQASYIYYIAIPVMLVPFIVIPAIIGTSMTMILVRFFPVKRVQQVLTVFGLILGAGLVMLFRFLRPEQLINEIGINEMLSYIENSRIPTSPYLPSTWATEVLMSLIEKNNTQALLNLLWLLLAASGVFIIVMGLAKAIYYTGWAGSAESRTVKTIQRGTLTEKLLMRISFLHSTTKSLLTKDIKLFWRDTTQWAQLLMLAALLMIYLFNIRVLGNIEVPGFVSGSPTYKNFISFLNIGIAGFVLASLGARFVYPSTSLEGNSFWVVHSAPIHYRRFLLEKFFIFLFPLVILAEILIVVSNILIGVGGYVMVLSAVTIFLMTIALTGLGVGMGAIYPKFINENPAQIAMSTGGILYMILSLLYIGTIFVLEAFSYLYIFGKLLRYSHEGGEVFLYVTYALIFLFSAGVTIIPLYLGIKHLKSFEIV
jgi:ABC-2 type transport system permease protein